MEQSSETESQLKQDLIAEVYARSLQLRGMVDPEETPERLEAEISAQRKRHTDYLNSSVFDDDRSNIIETLGYSFHTIKKLPKTCIEPLSVINAGKYAEDEVIRSGKTPPINFWENMEARAEEKFRRKMKNFHDRMRQVTWDKVAKALKKAEPSVIDALLCLSRTDGEPSLLDANEDRFFFTDCSSETPGVRRNLPYDRKSLSAIQKRCPQEYAVSPPRGNAVETASIFGARLITEPEYIRLQNIGIRLDEEGETYIQTPAAIRKQESFHNILVGQRRHSTTTHREQVRVGIGARDETYTSHNVDINIYHTDDSSFYWARNLRIGFRCVVEVPRG